MTPFLLQCIGCEAGDGIKSRRESIAAGWLHVMRCDDGFDGGEGAVLGKIKAGVA